MNKFNYIIMLLAVFLLIFGFDHEAETKERNPNLFQDFGMIVSYEERTYTLEIEKDVMVVYKATGESNKGNLDCAIFNSKSEPIAIDAENTNGCTLEFTNKAYNKYYFVIRNNSDNIQRFSASVSY